MNKWLKVTVFACVICALVFSAVFVDARAHTVHARTAEFHVVVDAGHGGRDGGATSTSGTKESDITLAIAKFLRKEFEARGVGVTMTRENHDSLASPFAGNRKKDDMNKRRQIIEKVKPDLVISIHLNNFVSNKSVRGLQTFFAKNSEPSKSFAEAIQNEINGRGLNTNRKAAVGDYYILKCTESPSVLVECGFLSNLEEEKLLKTAEYQKILAYYIASAVTKLRTMN